MVYTLVNLEITEEAYAEIRQKLRDAGYEHTFMDKGGIDMSGIALIPVQRKTISGILQGHFND